MTLALPVVPSWHEPDPSWDAMDHVFPSWSCPLRRWVGEARGAAGRGWNMGMPRETVGRVGGDAGRVIFRKVGVFEGINRLEDVACAA